ncbi:MAG: SO2930 family diheme c-type cytochrome [Myxococcota bacterium]
MITAALLACADPTGGSSTGPGAEPPEGEPTLDLVQFDGETVSYADGFVPYTIATPLFSDFAHKERAIRLPEGTVAAYTDDGPFAFPVGTQIVKSFLLPADLRDPTHELTVIETRVLTLEDDGWDSWPYLWNDDATVATRAPSGAVLERTAIGLDGTPVTFAYLVPQRNQCVDCHEATADGTRENLPIGPTARNLNVGDQLEAWSDAGLVDGLPPIDEVPAATDASAIAGIDPATMSDEVLFAAARDYLDANCAHCHNPDGDEGRSSQLFLNWDNDDAFRYGVCKKPGSAGKGTGGLTYDVVPGAPTESILWYRIHTDALGEMMPDIGRSLVDPAGVELVAEWIRRLEGACSD